MKISIKRHLCVFVLLCCMAAVISVNAADVFARGRNYRGQFSDVPSDSVFYANISAMYEYGLTEGKTDGTFGVDDNLTVGQTVIFAARIRSLYELGDAEAGASNWDIPDAATAERYYYYLESLGILDSVQDWELWNALTLPATRAQVAHILANTLPPEALPEVYGSLIASAEANSRYIPDVTEDTAYAADIFKLYRCGIVVGSDEYGRYYPNSYITRGATAAMLTRMIDPELRVKPQWNAAPSSLGSLISPGAYTASPMTEEEIDACIRYMLSLNESRIAFQYAGITSERANQIMEIALSAIKTYCEQSYNEVNCSYTSLGSVTLEFGAAGCDNMLYEYRESSFATATAVREALWAEGTINARMSDYEKALAYYTWICENCDYDFDEQNEPLNHIAYALFHDHLAVCDGYTGAYNLFLKLEGIPCTAISNSSHIWTIAELDGIEYHIDTTWGDSGSVISYDYFAMTEEISREYHDW